MPPRQSQRQKRPSTQALEAIATAPRRTRSRRTAPAASLEIHSEQQQNTAAQEHGPSEAIVIPPSVIEQLVTTVTAEVTKNLLPYLRQPAASHVPIAAEPNNGAPVPAQHLREVSLVTPPLGLSVLPSGSPGDVATEVMQQSLQSAHSAVAGELQHSTIIPSMPEEVFQSVSIPIDARVSAKLRAKIWNHEYIEFGSLLLNPILEGKMQITIQSSEGSNLPSLSLEPVSKPKKITSIDSWMTAFHIFVGVYVGKYPAEAASLMKYGEIVKDLAARGNNWKFYDENFRFLRQSTATPLPWGVIHWELWLRSQSTMINKGQSSTAQSPHGQGQTPLVPRGFCFKFHRGLGCTGCRFKHTCFKCDGNHRADNCNSALPAH